MHKISQIFILKYFAFFAGCFLCYILQVYGKQNAVMSVGLVGFFSSFLHFPKLYEKKGLHAAIFSGALAGMCSRAILENPIHVALLSIIGTCIYLLSKPHGNGFGGKLGTIAFVSCLFFFLAKGLL